MSTRDDHYRMRRADYRDAAREGIYAPHVKVLNVYVDQLRSPDRFVPYVSPEFGGDEARLLLLLLSPGEQTKDGVPGGSGFLSPENTDVGARPHRGKRWTLPGSPQTSASHGTNACPWFVHGLGGMKSAAQDRYLIEGTLPLLNVITRLPRLRAVFVFGGATDRAWKTFFGGEYPRTRHSLKYFYHRSTGPVGYRGSRTEQGRVAN